MNTTDRTITIADAVVGQHWLTLGAAPDEAIEPILGSLAAVYGLPVEALLDAYREQRSARDTTYVVSMWHDGEWVNCEVADYSRAVGLFTSLMLAFDQIELREDGELISMFKDGKVQS
jgi:hypothetical protein